jgi:hypothetical protein
MSRSCLICLAKRTTEALCIERTKTTFQPRIAAAWSPNFGDNWLGSLFGRNSESVIRGGFGITNDYFGQALAVRFDLNNTLGFSSSSQIPANRYNLTTNVGPRFNGFDQTIRNLPGINVPTGYLTFPASGSDPQFSDGNRRRIG